MIYILHGIAGPDNHSAIVGAVEATSPFEVQQALKKFYQVHPETKGQINRHRFNMFAVHSGLKIVPVVGVDLDNIV
jgi:hypothetical protein